MHAKIKRKRAGNENEESEASEVRELVRKKGVIFH